MINVTKPFLPDQKKFLGYIDQIYKNGWLTNYGPFCRELEQRLKDFLAVKNLILVTNGTLALQVAYKALGLTGSVVTTPFSFVATVNTLLWEGIQPIFADIDPFSFNIDPEKIEEVIGEDTSAIVPVHVFGNPCKVERIHEIAAKRNLKVIYDGAHAFGVNYKGESVLNWGDVATLSFHATKLFHTIEGGAIITKDDDLAKKIRMMINFGLSSPEKIDCLGINCKMNEFQAAMGLCVLEEIETIFKERKKVWDYYKNIIPSKFQCQQWNSFGSQNYHYFPILFDSEEKLKKAQNALNALEIFPRRYFYPSLDKLSFCNPKNHCPNSFEISKRILCLPFFPKLETHWQDLIVKTICI